MPISRPLLPAFIQTFLLLHWRIHIRITVVSKFKADPHKNPIPKLSTLIGHWNKKWTIARILKRDKTISIVIKVFLLSKCLRYFKYYIKLYDLYWFCSILLYYLQILLTFGIEYFHQHLHIFKKWAKKIFYFN